MKVVKATELDLSWSRALPEVTQRPLPPEKMDTWRKLGVQIVFFSSKDAVALAGLSQESDKRTYKRREAEDIKELQHQISKLRLQLDAVHVARAGLEKQLKAEQATSARAVELSLERLRSFAQPQAGRIGFQCSYWQLGGPSLNSREPCPASWPTQYKHQRGVCTTSIQHQQQRD
eukprot:TRINITY_DN67490_c14_g1_i1.p1 TRINITY_DN67490_c14_g1~~TRINITY_DN67490_c14_g1_i1.p1  ORF type:complete len:175 (-),score=19.28 TRINITY_DN67490_c14_g1_i1:496-1020(-)